jgi:vacuolar protein-sorting-associated protein 4
MMASDVNLKDVVRCSSAIDAIRESVVIPLQFPSLFKRLNVKRSNSIMLYGAPGTGKSMIARATASEVNACFFNASCAELTPRWVGGIEKKLQSLFAAAVRNSPCIIFFDEVDSIACKCEGGGSIADQRLTNQLLIELDNIFLAQNEVFVITATNLPWQIDLAVMRRFPHTVYIESPNHDSRKRMFRSFFKADICSDNNIDEHAQLSEHMSDSDIANVVNSILLEPIRILCRATHFSVSIMPLAILCSQHTQHCSVDADESNSTIHT